LDGDSEAIRIDRRGAGLWCAVNQSGRQRTRLRRASIRPSPLARYG